jgi:hypothetical protein
MKHFLSLLFFTIAFYASQAQNIACNMIELPMEGIINYSTTVVKGEVLSSESYWNKNRSAVLTKSEFRVDHYYKGTGPDVITIITEGGEVDDIAVSFSDMIRMNKGLTLIMTLKSVPDHWQAMTDNAFAPSVSLQGVFYLEEDGSMWDVFNRFKNISEFERFVNSNRSTSVTSSDNVNPNALPVNVISFSPTTVTAGTKQILTINGSGFGNVRGTGRVEFTSAITNNVGQGLNTDYIQWTDTQIKVAVPSILVGLNSNHTAASGPIKVINSTNESFTTTTNLTVNYALFNVSSVLSPDTCSVLNHGFNNGTGGFDFRFNTNLSGIGTTASDIVKRAMGTWICATSVQWSFDPTSTTSNNTVGDLVNAITSDVDFPLDPGVAARGRNVVFLGCFSNGFKPIAQEVDMIINNIPTLLNANGQIVNLSWNLSTANAPAGTVDLETTVLHEFGHILGLSHVSSVLNGNQIMRGQLNTGLTLRTLHTNDIAGATDALNRSATYNFCGQTGHQRFGNAATSIAIQMTAASPICSGSNAPFTATITNGRGAADVLSWKVNGTTINTNSLSFNASNLSQGVNTVQAIINQCGTTISSNIVSFEFYGGLTTVGFQSVCINNSGSGLFSISVPSASSPECQIEIIYPAGLSFSFSTGNTTYVNYSSSFTSGSIDINEITPCGSRPKKGIQVNRSPLVMSGTMSGATTGVRGAQKVYTVPAVAGSTSYEWAIPYMASVVGSATGNSVTVSFNSSFCSGTISCRAVNAQGCVSNSLSLAISGVPSQPSPITVTIGPAPTFTKTLSVPTVFSASSYTWTVTSGMTILTGQGTRTITISIAPGVTVGTACVYATNSCGNSVSVCKTVNATTLLSMDATNTQYLEALPSIYPNPSTEELNIQFTEHWNNKLVQMKVMAMDGKLIYDSKIQLNESLTSQFLFNEIPSGSYIISLVSDDMVYTLRWVKQN